MADDYTGIYRGSVYDSNDPSGGGRLRILIPQVLGDSPSGWSNPSLPVAPNFHPATNSRVWVFFEGGDINRPTYISTFGITSDAILPGAVTPGALSFDINDGLLTTYYQSNAPESPSDGDLWLNTDTQVLTRWNGEEWQEVIDPQIFATIQALGDVKAIADSKIRTFASGTAPSGMGEGDVGDLWIDIAHQNTAYRWDGDTWISVRDLGIEQAIADAADAQAIADGKVNTYFQPSEPTGMLMTDVGDMWFDTDDGNKMYRWDGSNWILTQDSMIAKAISDAYNAQQAATGAQTTATDAEQAASDAVSAAATASTDAQQALADALAAAQAAAAAQATADNAIRTYYQEDAPTGLDDTTNLGDLWYKQSTGQAYRWAGSTNGGWVVISDNALASALQAAQEAKDAADAATQAAADAVTTAADDATQKANQAKADALAAAAIDAQTKADAAMAAAVASASATAQTKANAAQAAAIAASAADATSKANAAQAAAAAAAAIDAQTKADAAQTAAVSAAQTYADLAAGNASSDAIDAAAIDAQTKADAAQAAATAAAAADATAKATTAQANATSAAAIDAAAKATAAQNAAISAAADEAAVLADAAQAAAVTAAAADATSKANTAQANAAAAAAADATAKANAAQAAATTAAQTYADIVASGASQDAIDAAEIDAQTKADAAQAAAVAAAAADATAKTDAAKAAAANDAKTKADAAQAAAIAAAAADATTKVATKGKVIVQASAPTGADANANNLWINTTGNANTPNRWTGSAWAVVTDKVATDAAANAVTAINNAATAQTKADSAFANAATADAKAVTAQSNAASALTAAQTAQTTADGKAVTYFQTTAPTGKVAGDVGDLWFDTDDGNKMYRWSGSAWVLSQDSSITTAINNAAAANTAAGNAQTTANSKITTFYQTTAPGATGRTAGDLWADTDDGNQLYRWSGSAWVSIRDTTIAATATAAAAANTLAQNALSAAQAAQAVADQSIRTYYQATAPTGENSTTDVGDLWFNTTTNQASRWSGTSWDLIEDNAVASALAAAQNAQATADGKISAFYTSTQPTNSPLGAVDIGDLWYDTGHGNKPYYASAINGATVTWTAIQDASIATAQTAATNAATAAGTAQTAANAAQTTANTAVTNASAAQTLANSAATSAAAAAGIANAKAVVLYQTSAPASTYQNALTLWIDTTSNANTPKRWSGSAWVAITDSAATAAATSAANAQAAANSAQTTANTAVTNAAAAQSKADTAYNNAATADAKAVTAQNNASTALANAQTAQTTADGKATTYFQTSAPAGLVAGDVGDLWFDTDDGNKMYRWSGSAWVVSQDASITTAINNAAAASTAAGTAQTTANSKIITFYQTTAPTATGRTVGDLWVNTSSGNLLNRWSGSAWVSIQDASISSAATAAAAAQTAANNAATAASTAQATADGKINTFYQSTAPTGQNTTTDVGDLWFNTTTKQAARWSGSAWVLLVDTSIAAALGVANSAQSTANTKITAYYQGTTPATGKVNDLWFDTAHGNKPYYCSSISPLTWTVVQDAAIATAQSTANSKITTYYQTAAPSAISVGDLWVDTDDNNKLYRATAVGTGNWVSVQDLNIPTALANASAAQTAANGKNKVWYSDTMPPLTGNAVNDIWFDTLNDSAINTWNGTTWVATVLGNAAIGNLDADHITAETLSSISANMGSVNVGPNIKLNSSDGITISNSDGKPRAQFPTDPALPISLTGDVEATHLTATGPVVLRAPLNEIAPSATLTIDSGTTAPINPPSYNQAWNWFTPAGVSADIANGGDRYGAHVINDHQMAYVTSVVDGIQGSLGRIGQLVIVDYITPTVAPIRYNLGLYTDLPDMKTQVKGVTQLNVGSTQFHVLVRDVAYRTLIFDTAGHAAGSTLPQSPGAVFSPYGLTNTLDIAFGHGTYQGNSVYLCARSETGMEGGDVVVRVFSANGTQVRTTVDTGLHILTHGRTIVEIGTKWYLAMQSNQTSYDAMYVRYTMDGTSVTTPYEDFYARWGFGALSGFGYDSTRGIFMDIVKGRDSANILGFYSNELVTYTGLVEEQRYYGVTWYDPVNGYETNMGPVTMGYFYNRSRAQLTFRPPDGLAARFYSASTPTGLRLQAQSAVGDTTILLPPQVTTTSYAPGVNTFPADSAIPGYIASSSVNSQGTPRILFAGNGTAQIGDMRVAPTGEVTGIRLPGEMTMFAGSTIPSGWLLCNGTTVSRTTYAALFAAIGTNYGAGNGSTTFTLPDLVTRFPRGGLFSTYHASGGSQYISTDNLPSHNHSMSHDHQTQNSPGTGSSANAIPYGAVNSASTADTNAVLGYSGNTGNAGGGVGYWPQYTEVNFMIKT